MNFKTLMTLCLLQCSHVLAGEKFTVNGQECFGHNNSNSIVFNVEPGMQHVAIEIKGRAITQSRLNEYVMRDRLAYIYKCLSADKYIMTEIASPTSIIINEENPINYRDTYINSGGDISISSTNMINFHSSFANAMGNVVFTTPVIVGKGFITAKGTVKIIFPQSSENWIESIEWQPSKTFLPEIISCFEGNLDFSPLHQGGRFLIYGTNRVFIKVRKPQ